MLVLTTWWTTKAWPWLKKNWVLLAGALGGLVAFIFWGRKEIDVVAPALVAATEKANEINAKADEAMVRAQTAERERLQAIVDQHSIDVKQLTADQRERLPGLVSDSTELNAFLLEVGKQARER